MFLEDGKDNEIKSNDGRGKDNKYPIGGGIQQALDYAELLDIPYAYSSHDDAFVEHYRLTGEERTIQLNEIPSHDEL